MHVHDIQWPFQYPETWLRQRRDWTETYLMHAFWAYNSALEVLLLNDWLLAGAPRGRRALPALGRWSVLWRPVTCAERGDRAAVGSPCCPSAARGERLDLPAVSGGAAPDGMGGGRRACHPEVISPERR